MAEKKSQKLNVCYSLLQILFNGAYCGIAGYASAFLLNAGFSNLEIGTITSISTIIGLVVQPFIGDLVDRSKVITEKRINIFMFALTALCAVLLMLIGQKEVTAVLYVVMTCALTVEIALAVALAFVYINRGDHINFSLGRGFGSLGYSAFSFILGQAAALWSPDVVIPICVGICLVAIGVLMVFPNVGKGLTAAAHPTDENGEKITVTKEEQLEAKKQQKEQGESLIAFCKHNVRFVLYIVAVVLIFFPHMIHATYWFQYVQNIGGTVDLFGTMASVSALLEFPIMAAAPWLMRKFGLRPIMIFSGIWFPIKVLLLGFGGMPTMWLAATIGQMFSFALFTPVSSYYASAITRPEDTNKVQLFLNFGRTAGTVFAAMIGGAMLDTVGFDALTITAAIIGAAGVVFMVIVAPKVKPEREYGVDQELK